MIKTISKILLYTGMLFSCQNNNKEKDGPLSETEQKQYSIDGDSIIKLTDKISVTPILVPHRDEFSETVGYSIRTGNKSALFIPDIDKWQKWDRDIKQLVRQYDHLFLDGTFYKDDELPGRNMNEVPHPFIQESADLFSGFSVAEKQKICFIHYNHTNPLIDQSSKQSKEVKSTGFNIAEEGLKISL